MRSLLSCLALLAACSSGGPAPDPVDGGGSGGSGGSGGCLPSCFAPSLCVVTCSDDPVDYGCCPCPGGTMDVNSCTSDSGLVDAGCNPPGANDSTPCGAETCAQGEVCVVPCCSASPPESCKPAPWYCTPSTTIHCSQCDSAGCSHQTCSGDMDGPYLECKCD